MYLGKLFALGVAINQKITTTFQVNICSIIHNKRTPNTAIRSNTDCILWAC